MIDKKKLMKLIQRQEGTKLDFKQKLDLDTESGKKELAKDICAIANSRGGRGYLIIGVEDKTKNIIGIDEKTIYGEEQLQQVICSRCEPPIPISLDIVRIDDKAVAVISIYDSDQKPYQLRDQGAFYIRRGSTTDTMRKQELISCLQEGFSFNVETFPVIKSKMEALNLSIIDKYFLSKGINVNDENRITLMESAAIISREKESYEYNVTFGGLLVFSEINSVYIPHNMIRIINKTNKSYNKIITIQGSLLTMMEESENMLKKLLPERYPSYAVFEGIKNAVLYRDYTVYYKEIEVIISHNSISVISPGGLIKSTKAIDKSNDNYFKRNMWIYEKLITLDERSQFIRSGRGFSRMKKAFKNHGKVIFINSIENNNFKVIYPGINVFK
jgi:predicted HTH transcriptional regulator